MKSNIIVIGGGIIGLSTAYAILKNKPDISLLLLEKESDLSLHQSGRNSGVVHSGVYYTPGSQKLKNCRYGRDLLIDFCNQNSIPIDICGKLILANSESQLQQLHNLYDRGRTNGVDCTLVDSDFIKEREPHAVSIKGILVKEEGRVDFTQVAKSIASKIIEMGGQISTDTKVHSSKISADAISLETSSGDYHAQLVINCAGLHCDRVANLLGQLVSERVVPFKGEYYKLKPEFSHLCNHLIYPVPNPSLPFLGVHIHKRIDGRVQCGPNAVLALGREAYTFAEASIRDLAQTFTSPGFFKLAAKHLKSGAYEVMRSLSKELFAKSLRSLVPDIQKEMITLDVPGIRAQVIDLKGNMVDDYRIYQDKRVISLVNAPSPGATASLSIGENLSRMALESLLGN